RHHRARHVRRRLAAAADGHPAAVREVPGTIRFLNSEPWDSGFADRRARFERAGLRAERFLRRMVESDAVLRPLISRRAFLATVPAAGFAGVQLLAAAAPRPFHIDIPQSTINRILKRVKEARWPDRLDSSDWRYGANWDYMKA